MQKISVGFVALLVITAGLFAAAPARADWGHWHHGWRHWHHHWWGGPVVVSPPAYYPPPPVYYAPPPAYYPAPAYYPPSVTFGLVIR